MKRELRLEYDSCLYYHSAESAHNYIVYIIHLYIIKSLRGNQLSVYSFYSFIDLIRCFTNNISNNTTWDVSRHTWVLTLLNRNTGSLADASRVYLCLSYRCTLSWELMEWVNVMGKRGSWLHYTILSTLKIGPWKYNSRTKKWRHYDRLICITQNFETQ